MKLILIALLAIALPVTALAQSKPADNPALIIAEGIVALVAGPVAVMYALGIGAFEPNRAQGYQDVCRAVRGKWENGSCIGGNWLNVIGMAPPK